MHRTAAAPLSTAVVRDGDVPDWVLRLAGTIPPMPARGESPAQWAPWRIGTDGGDSDTARELGLDARQTAAFHANLRKLVAMLRRAPVMREGNMIRLWTQSGNLVASPMRERGRRSPAAGVLMLGAWPEAWTRRDASGRLRTAGETSHFLLRVNRIPCQPGAPWMEDAEGAFFPLDAPPSPLPGTMALGEPHGSLLVRRPGRPDPYVPVARERVLRARIAAFKDADRMVELGLRAARLALKESLEPARRAEARRRIEQEAEGFQRLNRMEPAAALERATARERMRQRTLEEAANPGPDAHVFHQVRLRDALKSRLAAMSPKERAAPAWVLEAGAWRYDAVTFEEPGAPGAVPLVRPNPAFFDPKLPRTAIQIVEIAKATRMADAAVAEPGRANPPDLANLHIVRETDWVVFAHSLP